MFKHLEITFLRDSYDDGFGFLCMKSAYHYHITGNMHYGPSIGVFIHAEGESDNIDDFLRWINQLAMQQAKITNKSLTTERLYKEFDIEYKQ
jgi:acylphosphatase